MKKKKEEKNKVTSSYLHDNPMIFLFTISTLLTISRRKFDNDSLRSFMLKHLNTEFRVFMVYEFLISTILDIDFAYNIVKFVYEDVAKIQLCIVMRRS